MPRKPKLDWSDKDAVRKYNSERNRVYYTNPANKRRLTEYQRVDNQKLKLQTFTHYGNGTPMCANCGETDPVVLCLDHINGDGAEQRRVKRWTGVHLYRRLRLLGFPIGYQVLCFNCNTKKQFRELNYMGQGE